MKDRNGHGVRETTGKLAQQIMVADGSSFYDADREESKASIRAKALRLFGRRVCSHEELVEKPKATEEFSTPMIEKVIGDPTRSGLVSDELFVSEWVRQRFASYDKSKVVLGQELKEKSTDIPLRVDTSEQITHNAEEEVARKLAVKKAAITRSVTPNFNFRQEDLCKVVGALARHGFPFELSVSIARDQLEERYRELGEDTD